MVRIVVSPSGSFVPDVKGNLPGRGAYVCPDVKCISRASAGRLAHSLKAAGDQKSASEGLLKAVALGYRQRVVGLLMQAKKSGKYVSGTNLVEADLRRGPQDNWFAVLAEDASEDIAERITKKLKLARVSFRVFLGKEELGDILGKSPRSVVLIKDSGLARAIEESLDRYFKVLDKGGFDQ
jgi:ribosomal protein L7Ae-like RNA K-turn-binding protein